jgi:hypothetical protein
VEAILDELQAKGNAKRLTDADGHVLYPAEIRGSQPPCEEAAAGTCTVAIALRMVTISARYLQAFIRSVADTVRTRGVLDRARAAHSRARHA